MSACSVIRRKNRQSSIANLNKNFLVTKYKLKTNLKRNKEEKKNVSLHT